MIFNNKNATLILAKNQNNKNLTKSIYARFQEKKRQSVKPENIKHENTYLQFIRKFDIWNKSMSRKLIKNVAIISFLIEIIVEQLTCHVYAKGLKYIKVHPEKNVEVEMISLACCHTYLITNELGEASNKVFLGYSDKLSTEMPSDTWWEERISFTTDQIGVSPLSHPNHGFELLQDFCIFSGKILNCCIDSLFDFLLMASVHLHTLRITVVIFGKKIDEMYVQEYQKLFVDTLQCIIPFGVEATIGVDKRTCPCVVTANFACSISKDFAFKIIDQSDD
ncbi:hypothetical protein U3516DRAFT_772719 [Neocallimastix sp. 'constans']